MNKGNIEENKSRILNALKVISIFMVVTGHFFKEYGFLWIPVTVGLLIFSFSSGYFTSFKYKGNFSRKIFWTRKLERLGINLLVINAFLLCLFLIQGRPGIWTWHSLVNVIGLNGFLNWFRISDVSPFGGGMWYFTLLLIFYFFYPFIEKINGKKLTIFLILFLFFAFLLNRTINFGHALWLTASGFVVGVWAEKNEIKLPAGISRIFAFILFLAVMTANLVFDYNGMNFFFLLFFSLAGIYSCQDFKVPHLINKWLIFFSGSLLEIYLIHGYMFVAPTKNRIIDFVASFIIIIVLAKMLSIISSKIKFRIHQV